MTTKKKSKNAAKKSVPKKLDNEKTFDNEKMFEAMRASFHAAFPTPIDQRKELLAKVAGSIAASLVASPSPSIASPSGIATAAVDIAEQILDAVGLPAVESSVEAPPTHAAADVEAAS
jgi:hypothetical protein